MPVVVYAAYQDKTYLPDLFREFTRATGNLVIVRNGTVPGIVDDVLQDRVVPPADVLLTPSVSGVWRAAEEREVAQDVAIPPAKIVIEFLLLALDPFHLPGVSIAAIHDQGYFAESQIALT
jgi:hypothetical protein